jgi:mxaJ protein
MPLPCRELTKLRRVWLLPFLVLLVFPVQASAEPPRGPNVLRVCADPNGLPYSNDKEEGLENRLARLLAKELGWQLEYFWWAQRRGFLRNTLDAGKCDVVMGVPSRLDRLLTTRPYYTSSYVFLQRRGAPPIHSFDDPALRGRSIGVQLIGDDFANSPPAHALGRRNIIDHVRGFMVYGDYSTHDPQQPIVQALEDGTLDLAIVWGPLAGYYARRSRVPLEFRPVQPLEDGDLAMSFSIAMGVRKGDELLREVLERALRQSRRQVEQLLVEYGVPRLRSER